MSELILHEESAQSLRNAVIEGLSAFPKRLSSRWLYDDRGSDLFEQITALPEYYPTRTETQILLEHAQDIAAFAGAGTVLVEYGAGAGVKTRIVLNALSNAVGYVPIDIAGDFLDQTAQRLAESYPTLDIAPVVADFTTNFELPAHLPQGSSRLGFFPGSTIGNLDQEDATALLTRMRRHLGPDGKVLIGFDLIKSTDVLLPAYDDAQGVTAEFNLNLLRRINRELRGDIPLDAFQHRAIWNTQELAVEMHLVAKRDLTCTVAGHEFSFKPGETIHTESSRKYDYERYALLAWRSGWTVSRVWTDAKKQFAVVGLEHQDRIFKF